MISILCRSAVTLLLIGLAGSNAVGQSRSRARALGIPLEGTPGQFNAITDVPGVEVGVVTLISGVGKLVPGKGPIRTGVTAILPRGKASHQAVQGAWFSLNGSGEMTGTTWVEESGVLDGPIMITNTHSVGAVHSATVEWLLDRAKPLWVLPVVAETFDGSLNDVNGFHVRKEHAIAALDAAKGGPVAEGNVGGGTGMVCHQFKGGTGTSSRRIALLGQTYTVGVLVQCNYGTRSRLSVVGVPVGREIPDLLPCFSALPDATFAGQPNCDSGSGSDSGGDGSIIVVVATDVPLLPHQLKRVAKRAAIGIARMGGLGENLSGDIFIAFSTANPGADREDSLLMMQAIPNGAINPVFEATVEATSEAILNAMLAAETMTGVNGRRVYAIPHDRLLAALRKYGRVR